MEIGADMPTNTIRPLRHNGFQRYFHADSVADGVPTCRRMDCFSKAVWQRVNGSAHHLSLPPFAHYSAVAGIHIAVEL